MIVTPEGLNVFSEDVERALNEQPGVRDSAAVGGAGTRGARRGARAGGPAARGGHGSGCGRARRERALADHQKIARRPMVGEEASADRRDAEAERASSRAGSLVSYTARMRPRRSGRGSLKPAPSRQSCNVLHRVGRSPQTTIDELGLSSLERVELMMALEEAFQMTVDEGAFSAAGTVAQLEALVRRSSLRRRFPAQLPAPHLQPPTSNLHRRSSSLPGTAPGRYARSAG
jgi:long-chain acyl-CoA synthetase